MGITKNKQSEETIRRMAERAYPGLTMMECKELTEGLCNVAYAITLSDGEKKILKIGAGDKSGYMSNEINMMDAETCAMKMLKGKIATGVPAVDYYDITREVCSGSYFFMEMLEGDNYFFNQKEYTEAQRRDINMQIGQLVKQIADTKGEKFGLLGDTEHRFDGQYDLLRYMLCNAISDAERKNVFFFLKGEKLLEMLEKDKEIFSVVEVPSMVHYDLWEGNIFVKGSNVVGFIDWERALWGDPLMEDRFRRHTRNEDFLSGFGIEELSENQLRRIYWYDILLYLIMMAEGEYRMYEDDGQYRWVAPLFRESLEALMGDKVKYCTLCYIEKDENYLMLYRNKKENDPNEGKWIGVGGKLEDGETPDRCVVREVQEETCLVLTDYTYHGVVHFQSDKWCDEEMYLYTATGFTGEVDFDCSEGMLKWIPKKDIMELSLWEGDRIFLQYLLEGKKDIDLTLVYQGAELVEVRSK
ncbi:MAG: NUDIX domain-containing protein [Lachnospiraceae bacterium]|nr:NUDIX domain-containing protein [Lachnospiraceae bacterium]